MLNGFDLSPGNECSEKVASPGIETREPLTQAALRLRSAQTFSRRSPASLARQRPVHFTTIVLEADAGPLLRGTKNLGLQTRSYLSHFKTSSWLP